MGVVRIAVDVITLAAFLGLSAVPLSTQTQAPKDQSSQSAEVKTVVEQFCKLDGAGTWLGPERWHELTDFFASVRSWSPDKSVSVLKSYRVGDAKRSIVDGTVYYAVDVDYFVWGSINSSLRFTRARGPQGESSAVGVPVERLTTCRLSLTDSFVMGGPPWNEEKTKGTLRWRMYSSPSPNNLDADTTLRWVAEMRDKSNDPAIKYNAERTLAILRSLLAVVSPPVQPVGSAQEPPSEVADQFLDLETRLSPDKWSGLAKFFVETPKPQLDKVHIVDIVGSGVNTEGDVNVVEISTNPLGDLDSSLRLSNYPSFRLLPDSNSACYGDDYLGFTLLLSDKHWEIAADGAVKEFDGPFAWRIEETSFEPLITLDTAIRYVTERRAKTTDPVIKKNAARTLTILKTYKRGGELPKVLLSDSGGGCGG
jgi:hypothetical protein